MQWSYHAEGELTYIRLSLGEIFPRTLVSGSTMLGLELLDLIRLLANRALK